MGYCKCRIYHIWWGCCSRRAPAAYSSYAGENAGRPGPGYGVQDMGIYSSDRDRRALRARRGQLAGHEDPRERDEDPEPDGDTHGTPGADLS